jgi:hypothetical protein
MKESAFKKEIKRRGSLICLEKRERRLIIKDESLKMNY